MDEDDETKEEDPVVREIDVVLADWGDPTDDAPRPGLALLQYPIRARERGPEPFDAARIKVRHELLEVDVPATKSGPHVDERALERMRFDKRTPRRRRWRRHELPSARCDGSANCAAHDTRCGRAAYVDAADEADAPRPRRRRRARPKLQAAWPAGPRRATSRTPAELRAAPAGQEAGWLCLGAPEGRGPSRAKRAKPNPPAPS